MKRTKIRFSLVNRKTNSVITGTKYLEGKYFEIIDSIADAVTAHIPKFLKDKHHGEDPADWEFNGFQKYSEWKNRKDRAHASTN